MGTPKVKAYQLPTGYSENGDNDIQNSVNDELIPVVDKPMAPEDFRDLKGVGFVTGEQLISVNTSAGRYSQNLTPDGAEFQSPASAHTDILVVAPSGGFSVNVYDNNLDEIDPSEYVPSASGVRFSSIPYPSGATISYFRKGPETNTDFVGFFNDWYDGNNWEYRPVIYTSDNEVIPSENYTNVAPSGLVTLNTAASGIKADYSYTSNSTKYFIGERENWIFGHLYMNPDIFKGTFDYPGDDTEDPLGNPILQGPIPKFVEDSEYQIDFRKGLVTFPTVVNSEIEPVKANYAYLVGVRNVTGQVLTQISADPSGVGYTYKATSDYKYPESINASWIGRNDSYTPRNFYVNGELKPKLVTKSPFDELTIKQGP